MPLSLMHRQYIPLARTVIFFLLLLLATDVARAATFTVTTPGQQTLTNKFLPYAGSGTQLIGNSPAWRDSAGVLGINNYLEGLETLTPAAAVNLNFSTWRTKRITLNQNTVFTAINIPSASTNVQTMLLEVIGDGAFTVSFANVTWQTPEITTPEAGVVTLYALRGDSGAVKGYTQAVTATGIGPLTVGYVPVANATNNLTDSILLQSADTIAVQHGGTNSIELTGGASADIFLHADTGQPSSISSDDSILFNVAQGVTTDSFLLGNLLFRPSTVSQALLGDSTHPWIGVYADAHYWGGAVTSYDSGAGVDPEGVVTAGPGSIWRNTTTGDVWKKSSGLGDTGWVLLATGSGAALWSSSSGNLSPSPAVDVVSIQSQSANNATNMVLVVDTAAPWTNGWLGKFSSAGTNSLHISPFGSLLIGQGATNFWGASSTDFDQVGLAMVLDKNLDSTGFDHVGLNIDFTGPGVSDNFIDHLVYATSAFSQWVTSDVGFQQWDVRAQNTNSFIRFYNGGVITLLQPDAAATITPYTLGTTVSHTSGNLLEIPNNGTNKVTVDWQGNVTANGVTAAGINLTGIESFGFACSDETTPVTTGTAKVTFRMPYAFTVTAVRASLTTAQASGNIFTVDINEGASSILSTKITIDNTETTSVTAVTAPVISDSALADDASMTIDIDQIGNGSATGLKVWIIGHQ